MLGDLERDFPELSGVTLPPARPPTVRSVAWRMDGDAVIVGLPAGARLRVTEILSVGPSRIRRWMLEPGADQLRGPGFARHN